MTRLWACRRPRRGGGQPNVRSCSGRCTSCATRASFKVIRNSRQCGRKASGVTGVASCWTATGTGWHVPWMPWRRQPGCRCTGHRVAHELHRRLAFGQPVGRGRQAQGHHLVTHPFLPLTDCRHERSPFRSTQVLSHSSSLGLAGVESRTVLSSANSSGRSRCAAPSALGCGRQRHPGTPRTQSGDQRRSPGGPRR